MVSTPIRRVVAWFAQALHCSEGQVYTLATGLIFALTLALAGQK